MSETTASLQPQHAWLLSIGVALSFAWCTSELAVIVDDAYIGFRYAQNLAHHGELVYNLGERVEGYSNPLWTIGLGLGAWLGADPLSLAVALGLAAGLSALWCVAHAARTLGASPPACFAGAALVATNPSFAFWSTAGLESALFAVLLLLAWIMFSRDPLARPAGVLAFSLVTALAGLTRFEASVFALAAPALLAWRGVRGRALLISLSGPALIIGHLFWRQSYYAAWLPTPVVAKVGGGSASVFRGLSYILHGLWEDGSVFVVPIAALALTDRRTRSLAAAIVAYLGFVAAAGGDGLYRYRFLAHVTPAAGVLVAVGLTRLARWSARAALAAASLAALGALTSHARDEFFRGASLADVREWEQRWTLVGEALRRVAPGDALLATNVAGRTPYSSGLRTLDLLGLTDAVVARASVDGMGGGYAGHERAAPAYVLARQPDLLYLSVLDGLPAPLFRDRRVLSQVLSSGSLYRYAVLVDAPDFADRYRPAFLQLADGRRAGVLVRSDGRVQLSVERASWLR